MVSATADTTDPVIATVKAAKTVRNSRWANAAR
jgi:hypothetical protein